MDLADKIILLGLGFVCTTIFGGIWGYFLRKRSWENQVRQDLYRARYDEGTQFLNDISTCIGERYYYLQRLFWAIQEGKDEGIDACENDYFPIMRKWNASLWRIRNKLRLLVNQETADSFLDYADDNRPNKPKSLHYHFVFAHRIVLASKSETDKISVAENVMTELNWHCSSFLESATTEFLRRASALQLLKAPEAAKSIEHVAPGDAAARRLLS